MDHMGIGQLEKAINSEEREAASFALNFEVGQNGVVPLLPPGPDIVGRDGRAWKLTNPQLLVEAFVANQADLPIDIEHATQIKAPKGEPAPAVGWIKNIRVADNGAIVGDVEWNAEGVELVGGKKYRYISPVFIYDKKTLEIMRLTSAGLTNNHNLGLPALNRQTTTPQEEHAMWKKMCAKLGLAETATEDEAINAVSKMQADLATALNRAETPSLDKFVPRGDYDQAMNRATAAEQKLADQAKEQTETAINAEIEAAMKAGKITPASKDFYLATCRADGGLEQFRKFIKTAPVIADNSGLNGKDHNQDGVAMNADQAKIAAMFGNSADDIKKYGSN